MFNQQCFNSPVFYKRNRTSEDISSLCSTDKMNRKRRSVNSISLSNFNYLNINNTHIDSEGSTRLSNQLSNNPFKFKENSYWINEYKRDSLSIFGSNVNQTDLNSAKSNEPIISKFKEINDSKQKSPRKIIDLNQFLIKINTNNQGKESTHLIEEEEIEQNIFTLRQSNQNEIKEPIGIHKQFPYKNENRRMIIELTKCINRDSHNNVNDEFDKLRNEFPPNNINKAANNNHNESSEINFNEAFCSFRKNTFDHNDPVLLLEESFDEPTKTLCLLLIPKIVIVNNRKLLMSITPLTITPYNKRDSYAIIFKTIDTMKQIQKLDFSEITECDLIANSNFVLQYIERKTFRKLNLTIRLSSADDCEEYVNGIIGLLNERSKF